MLKFTKMHGAGNDYIYINCLTQTVADKLIINYESTNCKPTNYESIDPVELAIRISDRHFGVGSDGLVLIMPASTETIADFRMRMFNADGSEGNMCGNAIRCVGKYVYDKNLTDKTQLLIETKSGVKSLNMTISESDGTIESVLVDMGKADLCPKNIPILSELEQFISQPVLVNEDKYFLTCVSMGSPHAVCFIEKGYVDALNLEYIGHYFEHNEMFPERINTEFAEIIDEHTVKMRVWERGSGETLACGTGACAVVVASVLNGYFEYDTEITVILRGGELTITYKLDGTVLMRGTATHVFDGEISE